jgi:hypothetical protein
MIPYPHNENIKPLKTHENKLNIPNSYDKIFNDKNSFVKFNLSSIFQCQKF